ncbi:uncharacterized protein LOC125517657 [Triticum urartu]|uniref:uncharacterized protein LOC125517657 n=1 Tax=Triticum urartu TaxID=4572 RepID=UPI0020436945|nr:uncharacterized protein LOC125517657 [Triticum urartu]
MTLWLLMIGRPVGVVAVCGLRALDACRILCHDLRLLLCRWALLLVGLVGGGGKRFSWASDLLIPLLASLSARRVGLRSVLLFLPVNCSSVSGSGIYTCFSPVLFFRVCTLCTWGRAALHKLNYVGVPHGLAGEALCF